ncbi:MAG: hypothetical protein K2X87_34945 [Gemmataceae bacterium]|nr:hypothetical protein [Gemmataceae bacterium]
MRGVLPDHNCEGHVTRLLVAARAAGYGDFWDALGLAVESFAAVGLHPRSPDSDVWRTCQREQLVLVTVNRNHRGPDSLEAVIRAEGVADSLPVLTIGDENAVIADRGYALRAFIRLFDYLDRIGEHRGAGRLYIP